MIRVSGQSKSGSVKAAGAESCAQRRNQKLHAAVARRTFQVKMKKTEGSGSSFCISDVQNLREAVERRTFASQNVKKMLCLRQFLTLRCRENS